MRKNVLNVAALLSAVLVSDPALAQRYFARTKLMPASEQAAVTPTPTPTTSPYDGTWTYGAPSASSCVGGSRRMTSYPVCSPGGTCDPSTRPNNTSTQEACKTQYTCPGMAKNQSHNGVIVSTIATIPYTTAAQTAIDGHTACENSTVTHGWCTMTIPVNATPGMPISVMAGTGGSYLSSSDPASYSTFTCNITK